MIAQRIRFVSCIGAFLTFAAGCDVAPAIFTTADRAVRTDRGGFEEVAYSNTATSSGDYIGDIFPGTRLGDAVTLAGTPGR